MGIFRLAEWVLRDNIYANSFALLDTNRPMINPNSPRTELKISITSTLTNLQPVSMYVISPIRCHETYRVESAASAKAALLPLMPTDTPQMRLHIPTVTPDQKRAKPV